MAVSLLIGLVLVAFSLVPHSAATVERVEGVPAAVVFERGGDLYAVAVDGSRTVRLTKTRTREYDPAVSPDGRTIAYAFAGGIWTMSVDGKRRTRLTRGADTDPAWSPDGRTIFFSRSLPGPGPVSCGSIFRVGTYGRNLRRVTRATTGPPRWHSHFDPAVSPDGRRIAFTDADQCEGGTTSFAVRVIDRSGRRTNELARLPGNRYYPTRQYEGPAWSPDGSRLALASGAVVLVNRAGTGLRQITRMRLQAASPAWSSDGRWIAFGSFDDRELYVVRPDGTGLRRLTRDVEYGTAPTWLPYLPRG
jgi:Tol biopolymer transport system component